MSHIFKLSFHFIKSQAVGNGVVLMVRDHAITEVARITVLTGCLCHKLVQHTLKSKKNGHILICSLLHAVDTNHQKSYLG